MQRNKGIIPQRKIIFNTEQVMLETRSGETVSVIMNYDSWAGDTSVTYKLQSYLHKIENEGNLRIQQYGSVIAQPNTCTGLVKIKDLNVALRFMINQQEHQYVSSTDVNIPEKWRKDHGLNNKFKNASGKIELVLEMDNYKLHPRFIDSEGGLVLSKSVITNNLIIGGKLDHLDTKKEEDEETKKQILGDWSTQLTGNKSVVSLTGLASYRPVSSTEEKIAQDKAPVKEENNVYVQCHTVTCGDGTTDELLKYMANTECPNPLKRCMKCKNCEICRKIYLPDQEKNEEMIKMMKKNVIFNNEEKCYEASNVYNKDLQMLPSYEEEVLRMQMSLERKLVGAKKADQFNPQVSEFFDRKVLE